MRVWLSVLVGLALFSSPTSGEAAIPSLLDDLRSIEAEMAANQERIEGLQAELGALRVLGLDSQSEIQRLQFLVEDHSARVKELGERYAQALVTAQRLERDLEASTRLNWLLGGSALVAVLVVAGETFALAVR